MVKISLTAAAAFLILAVGVCLWAIDHDRDVHKCAITDLQKAITVHRDGSTEEATLCVR